MNFKDALEALKTGLPVKRKQWQGYWVLEGVNKIVIHLKEGTDLNLVDTEDITFTLSHTTENDWEIATTENCKRLREDRE
jgi:hypothetical protein